MADPLIDAANAISDKSPAIKRFALLAAQRIIADEAPPPPILAPTPPLAVPPAPVFTQGYSAAEVATLRTAGNIIPPKAYSVTFPSDKLARFEVRSGDQWLTWSGERAAIQLPQPTFQGGEGDEWSWSTTFMLDPGFQFSTGFYNVLWQAHHTSSQGSPPITVQLHGDRVVLRIVKSNDMAQSMYWDEFDLGAATPGTAQGLAVACHLSTDAAKGVTLAGIDHNTAVMQHRANLLTQAPHNYVEWGLYRAPSPLTQVVSFGPMVRTA